MNQARLIIEITYETSTYDLSQYPHTYPHFQIQKALDTTVRQELSKYFVNGEIDCPTVKTEFEKAFDPEFSYRD